MRPRRSSNRHVVLHQQDGNTRRSRCSRINWTKVWVSDRSCRNRLVSSRHRRLRRRAQRHDRPAAVRHRTALRQIVRAPSRPTHSASCRHVPAATLRRPRARKPRIASISPTLPWRCSRSADCRSRYRWETRWCAGGADHPRSAICAASSFKVRAAIAHAHASGRESRVMTLQAWSCPAPFGPIS